MHEYLIVEWKVVFQPRPRVVYDLASHPMPLKKRMTRNIQKEVVSAESAAQLPFMVRLMRRTRLLP